MDERIVRLQGVLRERDGVVVAYSGGVDSALLAVVATQVLGPRAVAVTAVSPSLAERERRDAKEFARAHGVRHIEICTDEGERADYVRNDGQRCFHCKSALFEAVAPIAEFLDVPVALGTNLDDLGEHRPGLGAARLHGAIAPLVEAGLDKRAVRDVSALLGLATAAKPAQPCLASRVAYGDPVTPELLARIDAGEQALHRLGFTIARVRTHGGGSVARVEVAGADVDRLMSVRHEVDAALRACGFTFCSLDLAGFASGRLNALLSITPRRSA